MLLMQSLSLLGDTNDGNNSDNIYIYIKKSYFWLGWFWLWGFRFSPKFSRKHADKLFCLVLLQVPKLVVLDKMIFGWTNNIFIAAPKIIYYLESSFGLAIKSDLPICYHLFEGLFTRKHTLSPRIMRFPLTRISTYADFSLCTYALVGGFRFSRKISTVPIMQFLHSRVFSRNQNARSQGIGVLSNNMFLLP